MKARRNTDRTPAPLHLLTIDDDPDYRRYISAVAKRHGWVTSAAEDGEAALALLPQQAVDLLLVDYQMPRLDGMELIARVRADEALRHSYAIMLTARGDMDTKVAALTAGFDDFLAKSAAEAEIAAKLLATKRLLARQQKLDVTVRRLYGLATRDELTGVFNRRFFIEETERLLAAGVPLCLVLFDLDDFKGVNDSYGHLAGDHILRDVGALFHAGTRGEDLIARYGGDEFVMVATNLPFASVERLTARLASRIAELRWSIGAATLRIGATTGIASTSLLPAATVEQLLHAADRDLYKNKWLRKHPDQPPAVYDTLQRRDDLVLASPRASDETEPRDAPGAVRLPVRPRLDDRELG